MLTEQAGVACPASNLSSGLEADMRSDSPSHTVHPPRTQRRALLISLLVRTFLCWAGVLVICSTAAASEEGPRRPLSEDEQLALSVSEADAIIIGYAGQLRDTTFAFWPQKDLTLRPLRWLKGSGGSADLHFGLFEDEALWRDIGPMERDGQPIAGVFFLRRSPRGWMSAHYGAGYKRGRLVRLDRPTDETPETRAIEAMVKRQSLDSLLIRADLVILGHSVPPYSRGRVRVDRVLTGSAPGDTVVVGSPWGSSYTDGPGVFFLRRVSSNHFETVGFRAGSVEVHADTLVRMGIPLGQVLRRTTELRQQRSGDRGGRP
jgi:hypothetical protein